MKRSTKGLVLAMIPALTWLVTGARPHSAPAGVAGADRDLGRTPATVNVQMFGDEKGMRFEPKNITIKVGDVVTWTNTAAVPHNVAFWADSVPAKGKDHLQANMPKTIQPLSGPMLVAAKEQYTISFAGATPGVYKYYCLPHLALGMVGEITVKP